MRFKIAMQERFVDDVAARDKYSSFHRHLLSMRPEPEWRTTFGALEAVLGSRLPVSTQPRRPLWSNPRMDNDHSLAQQAARWRLQNGGIKTRTTVLAFQEMPPEPNTVPVRQQGFSIREILPPYDPGPWPDGFTMSREQIYDDMGRLTGGHEDMPGDNH